MCFNAPSGSDVYDKTTSLIWPDLKKYPMMITTKNGRAFDTDRDLSAPERHILQKLIIWVSFASSVEEFREKKKEALLKGWNNSGPIQESEALGMIVGDFEDKVSLRLAQQEGR
jgi:hypothetical protein